MRVQNKHVEQVTRGGGEGEVVFPESAAALLCAGSEAVAVQQNGAGPPGARLEGRPRAHHVLLQEGAVQLRGVRLPDQDGGVHTQSKNPQPPPPPPI